ncbi:hypothetical protein CASFOL_036804 [Castilleja foliolosa]|uniref:Pentatricopeptide repeat-containing protein n=1 Tax=Castilleja foliolosa TaxID=1961234 RepID=A0ABD3BPW0_9LAMI
MNFTNLHSLVSPPSCANIRSPKLSFSHPHYPLPSENTFSDALFSLRTCTDNKNTKMGSCFHAHILKSGLETDVFIANSLLNMYSKFDQLKNARNVFDQMPHRTIVSWTSIMSAYNRHGLTHETILLFSQLLEHHLHLQPNEFTLSVLLQACASKGDENLVKVIQSFAIKTGLISDTFLQNSLIDAYSKSGKPTAAEKLMGRLYSRDVVSWTSIISGYLSRGDTKRALASFLGMQEDGVLPNDVTMLTVLKVCSDINELEILKWVHGLVMKGNWCLNSVLVLNSLMEMYSINGYFVESMKIFLYFCFNNNGLFPKPETMASILHGCGNLNLGKEIHGYLIKNGFLPCIVAENSLINMYGKNGSKDSALILFRRMVKSDIISWNTIINCFVKNDDPGGALRLLGEIHGKDDVFPDFVTGLTSLEACSDLVLLTQGQIVHGYLTRTGLLMDIFVQNALIDMYAKSGRLDHAVIVFDKMPERDIGSWNSIIAAYGMNGDGISALKLFDDLKKCEKIKLNEITFVNILSACAHAGLVEAGLDIFDSMDTCYGVKPSMEHFACVVDMLGRAGRIEDADRFVDKMPVQPGCDVWAALLGACAVSGNLAVAEKAARELEILGPENSVWRVALSNVYAAAGEWQKVAAIRAEMRGTGMRKEGGWSSVNVDGFELRFMAAETRHPESAVIYEVIGRLRDHMRDA